MGHVPALLRDPLRFVRRAHAAGPVAEIRLGRTTAYVLNDPDLVRRALVDEVASFDKGVQYDKLRMLLGNGLSLSAGVDHRTRRRTMQPAFHHERMRSYAEIMRETTVSALADWRVGQIRDIEAEMRSLSSAIVARCLCSATLDDAAVDCFRRDLPTVLRGVAWRALSPVEFPERLPLPYNRRFRAANARLRAAVEELIRRPGQPGDLLSLLSELSPGDVRDEMVNLLFAGTETTGNALSFVWYVLATRPDIKSRLHTELAAGGRAYLARVIKETLRLYPPPWLVSRRVRTAVRLGETTLPVGATVLFSPYAIQRDPRVYADPDTFDPDRWLAGRADAAARAAYLPFGAGPHKCIGEGLALAEMVEVVATVAERFQLTLTGPTGPKASATLVPRSLRMRVESRAKSPEGK